MSADEAIKEKSKRRRKQRHEVEENDDVAEPVADDRSMSERKGRATPSKRARRGGAPGSSNFVVRMARGIRGYLGGVKDELDKVVWPTREELIRLAWIVLAVTLVSALVLGLISFIYNQIFIIGIRDGHPEIFMVLFGALGVGYFLYARSSRKVKPY